jgi:hypothetical protein
MRTNTCFTLLFLVASLVVVAGCGDDDDPITPEPNLGTVVVDPTPDSIAAPWTLVGPGDYSHDDAGDQTLNGLAVGECTLTWQDVTSYVTPAAET